MDNGNSANDRSGMMNVLMVLANSFTHDPRVYNEARSLVNAGHKVTVLAWDRKKENCPHETKDGIRIYRIYNTRFMDMLPYGTLRLRFWWKNGYLKALELQEGNSFDVVHCHDLDTLPIGIKLKKKLGLSLVYDAHEIYGYMVARFLPKWWANYFLRKERHIVKHVDVIITVNDPLKEYFSKMTNTPITIVMNCKRLLGTTYEPPNNDIFTLLYIGTLSKPRFLIELVNVVNDMTDVYGIIGGFGAEDYIKKLKDICSQTIKVDFIDRVPMENVLPMTKKADVIICMTDPTDPNNSRASANKQFEAMIYGRPIICTKETYPGKLTEELQCGLAVDYNEQSLKDGIMKLRDNRDLCTKFGKNAIKAAIKKYNWEKQEERLLKRYENLKK